MAETKESLIAAFDATISRDPRQFGFGIFSHDDWAGGAGLFSWFDSASELLDAIPTYFPALNRDPGEQDFADYRSELAAIRDRARPADELTNHLRMQFNRVMENDSVIKWWGTFNQLRSGRSKFAINMRESFHECYSEEQRPLSRSIREQELDNFVEFLRGYGY
jgi:hypothetical protein